MFVPHSPGSIVSLVTVDRQQNAIALANDTKYCLTSAVLTYNLFRGRRMASRLSSGRSFCQHDSLLLHCAERQHAESGIRGVIRINGMTVHDAPILTHGERNSSGFGWFGRTLSFDKLSQNEDCHLSDDYIQRPRPVSRFA